MKRVLMATAVAALIGCGAQAATPPKAALHSGAFAHPAEKKSTQAIVIGEPDARAFGQAGNATHSVVLTWSVSPDAAANPAVTYNAYRLTGACSSTATFTKINTAPITALTFTDASVAPGAYCYYVTAALNGIESVPSNQAAAAILVLPPGSLVLSAK